MSFKLADVSAWFTKRVFDSKRRIALDTLRAELATADRHRLGTLIESDSSTPHFKVGAEITLCIDDDESREYVARKIAKIKALNEDVAKRFGLRPIGVGPVVGEMGIKVVCCGFHRSSE